jgi:GDP-mannose 6-dehydrogenase
MKVSIFGLGYIGSVCVAGILQRCDTVFIVETDLAKLDSVGTKKFLFPEAEVANRINKADNIIVSYSRDELFASDAILICLPTEPKDGNALDLKLVMDTLDELSGESYKGEVIIRSTLDLSSAEILATYSSLNIFVVPEFLREGSALSDFEDVECLVVGKEFSAKSSQFVRQCLAPFSKTVVETNIASAIFIKLLNNSWHALKVVFANEWSSMAGNLRDVNAADVHQAFVADERLNISNAYLRPGGPYGGPCLTKDIAAFSALSEPTRPSLFTQAIEYNNWHVEQLALACNEKLLEVASDKFSFDTLEFKKDTNDERHSPIWRIISILENQHGKKYVPFTIGEPAFCFCGRSLMDHGVVKTV